MTQQHPKDPGNRPKPAQQPDKSRTQPPAPNPAKRDGHDDGNRTKPPTEKQVEREK